MPTSPSSSPAVEMPLRAELSTDEVEWKTMQTSPSSSPAVGMPRAERSTDDAAGMPGAVKTLSWNTPKVGAPLMFAGRSPCDSRAPPKVGAPFTPTGRPP